MKDAYRLLFRTPYPDGAATSGIDLNPDVTTLQWQSDIAGGYQSLQAGLNTSTGMGRALDRIAAYRLHSQIGDLFDVTVYRAGQPPWNGRITKIDSVGADVVGFQAQGYGVSAGGDGQFFASKDTPANTALVSSGTILQMALPTAAPLLSLAPGALFADPGVQHAPAEFDQKTGQQILDQLTQEAGTAGVLYDCLVFDDQQLRLVPRLAPDLHTTIPDYLLPLDASTPLSRVSTDLVGTVRVQYTDYLTGQSAITDPVTDQTFAARYPGLLRTKTVQAGTMSATAAVAYGLGYLSIYAYPIISCPISRSDDQPLERWAGGTELPEQVRPGQWVQLGEPLPQGHPAQIPPLVVIRTRYDATARTLTAELGARSPNEVNMLTELRRVAGSLKAGTNPNSRAAA